jgi:peptidoglycan-associated lipoprotein
MGEENMQNSFTACLSAVAITALVAACANDNVQTTDKSITGDQRPPVGVESNDLVSKATEANRLAGDRVFFDYDKSILKAEGRATLERQAAWLKQYPTVQVTVEGHCDERGTREYNLALGDRRASAAKSYLVSLGIPESRIKTISYGKERPVAVESSEDSYSKNRRAVTIVTGLITSM